MKCIHSYAAVGNRGNHHFRDAGVLGQAIQHLVQVLLLLTCAMYAHQNGIHLTKQCLTNEFPASHHHHVLPASHH
jgi:hypothetical protein